MTVLEYIALRSPEQATDPRVSGFVEIAESMTGAELPEPSRTYCVGLRALHLLTTPVSGDFSSGTVTSVKEGDLSESYGLPDSDLLGKYPDLQSSCWGVELISLYNSLIFGPRNRDFGE